MSVSYTHLDVYKRQHTHTHTHTHTHRQTDKQIDRQAEGEKDTQKTQPLLLFQYNSSLVQSLDQTHLNRPGDLCRISHSKELVHRIVQSCTCLPNKFRLVHGITEDDYDKCVRLWLNNVKRDPIFFKYCGLMKQYSLSQYGPQSTFCRPNCTYWDTANSKPVLESELKQPRISVCGASFGTVHTF